MATSVTVGAVQVDLVAGLAKFKDGMREASGIATRETRGMAQSMRSEMQEARGSLALVSEEFGIHLPRHLRNFIATLPGVAPALAAAFNSVAVLALIGVIVKVIEHIQKFKKEAEEAGKKWDEAMKLSEKTSLENQQAIADLHARFVGLAKGPIAEMEYRLAHVNGLLSELKLNEGLDKQIKDLSAGLHTSILEFGNTAQKDFDDIIRRMWSTASTPQERFSFLSDEIAKIDARRSLANAGGTVGENERISLDKLKQALEALLPNFDGYLSRRAEEHKFDEQSLKNAQANEAAKSADAIEKERTAYEHLLDKFKEKVEDPFEKIHREAAKAEAEVRKMATDNPALFAKAFPHNNVDTLVASIHHLAAAAEDKEMLKALEQADAILTHMAHQSPEKALENFKNLKLDFSTPALPTLAPDAKGITSVQREIEDINSGSAKSEEERAKAAQKFIDMIQTQNDKYRDQLALLEAVKKDLSPEQYDKAKQQIDAEFNHSAQLWKELGKDIGDTIKAGALFGRSWSDMFKTLGIEIAELIVKMTLLKNVASSGASGNTSFLGGLIGVFGGFRAEGGPVLPGEAYVINERQGGEWFVPDQPGTIVPSMTANSGGRPLYITQHFNFPHADPEAFMKSQAQVGNAVHRSISIAAARNS